MNIKLFETVKEIRSKAGELHFTRFAILEIPNIFSIYIHKIYTHDKDPYLHNHPWNFLGIILKGGYEEETLMGKKWKTPGTVSIGTRHMFHKISMSVPEKPTTSLFFTWGKYVPWGYMKGFENGLEYRKNKNEH